MDAFCTDSISASLETFLDHNAGSHQLCAGILYQLCQAFQSFSIGQEVVDQKHPVTFS